MGIADLKKNKEKAIEYIEDLNAGIRELKEIVNQMSEDIETMEIDYKDEEGIDEFLSGYEVQLEDLDSTLLDIQSRVVKLRSVSAQIMDMAF